MQSPLGGLAAWAVAVILLVLPPVVARAQEPSAPVAGPEAKPPASRGMPPLVGLTARRMVLPARILLPYAHFIAVPPASPSASTRMKLLLGVSYGLGNDWMLDTTFAPLDLTPFRYGNPEFALTHQVTRSQPFELGLTGRVFFRSDTLKGNLLGGVEVGAPAFFRFGERVRLDVAAWLPVSTSQQPVSSLGVTRAGLRLPATLYYQFDPRFLVAVGSGLNVRDLGTPGESFSVPLTLSGGFSARFAGVWLDVFPYVSLPVFYSRAGVGTSPVVAGLFVDLAQRL